jgi:hypothetical protein
MERGARRFKKRAKGRGKRIKRKDRVDRPDLAADFTVVDCIVEPAIARQRV